MELWCSYWQGHQRWTGLNWGARQRVFQNRGFGRAS